MTKKASQTEDHSLIDAVRAFAEQALTDGAHPADLSYALTVVAARTGLDLAPSAGVALAVVMKAASDIAMEWASAQRQQEPDHQGRSTAPTGTTVH
jgi:hypothetical protein